MTQEQKKLARVIRNWWELKDWQFDNRFYFYQAMGKRIKRFLKEEDLISNFEYIDAIENKVLVESIEDCDIYHKDFYKWEEYFRRKLPEFIAKAVLPETELNIYDELFDIYDEDYEPLSNEELDDLYNSIDISDNFIDYEWIAENLSDRVIELEKINWLLKSYTWYLKDEIDTYRTSLNLAEELIEKKDQTIKALQDKLVEFIKNN